MTGAQGAMSGGTTTVTVPACVSFTYTEPLVAVAEKSGVLNVTGVVAVPMSPPSEARARVQAVLKMLAGTPVILE